MLQMTRVSMIRINKEGSTNLANGTSLGRLNKRRGYSGLCIISISTGDRKIPKSTYMGINPSGAVIGAAAKLHHIFLRCNSCLSVAIAPSRAGMRLNRTELPGKSTSILWVPYWSSRRRCALSEGMLFSPHSSYGMRCCIRFPQWTRCFFQPLSASSQLAQV